MSVKLCSSGETVTASKKGEKIWQRLRFRMGADAPFGRKVVGKAPEGKKGLGALLESPAKTF